MGDSKAGLNEPAPSHSWVWEALFSRSLVSTHYTALAFLLAVCIPSAPRKSVLRYGLLLLQITCALQALVATPPPISDSAVLCTSGVLIANLLARYFDRLYTTVPEETFYRITSINQSKEDATKLPLIQRLLWALELFSVTRGIGWNWRLSRTPEFTAPKSRARFVTARFLTIIAMYAGLYLLEVTCQELLASYPGPGIADDNLIKTLVVHLFLYALIVLGLSLAIYSHFALLVLPLSIICVGLQIGPVAWRDMSAWPPDYGSLWETYSVRRFWGMTWHQQLRRQTGAPAAYIVSLLPEAIRTSKRRSARLIKRYLLVLITFFVSGLIHGFGSYHMSHGLGLPLSCGGEVSFYISQGVFIILEDFGCWILGIDDRSAGEVSKVRRYLGYAVTAGWYSWSRVHWSMLPVALASGIQDERGPLFIALEHTRRSLAAIPGNFVAKAWKMSL
ncbi:hypothetical protein CBS76997_5100 [Aspergillus niger]|nr:hypothetical protein CBS13152_5403 [Aspergillus niger]KAI3044266.1 hypothetical protein CBS76997_5100 [Aspergillus niger]